MLRELDRKLDLEHRISIREFDVLINLDIPAGGGLGMSELAIHDVSGARLSAGEAAAMTRSLAAVLGHDRRT